MQPSLDLQVGLQLKCRQKLAPKWKSSVSTTFIVALNEQNFAVITKHLLSVRRSLNVIVH